ncbi:MAG: outer membrane protein assembly factor BamD [Phycisphaerales bacterium]
MRQAMKWDQGLSGTLNRLAVRRPGMLTLLTCLLIASTPLHAQQRYDLEDGQWVAKAAADPNSPEGQLDAIRKLVAQDEGKKAKHAADDWIEKYENNSLMPEALLTRGDANVARKHFFKSLYDYERVIREYPGSEQFQTAMQREFEVAKLFMAGVKRRLWGMRILPATDEAEELLVRIQERGPGSELGELASITLADYYFDKPQMDSAADAYDLFLINYPRSERREWAMIRLIQANLARFKGPRFDATGLIDAGQRLKSYRTEYPASAERLGVDALLIRIDESLAMRDMVAADWHVQRKQPLSAIYLYQRVIQDYPRTAAALDALKALSRLGAEPLAMHLPTNNDEAADVLLNQVKPARPKPGEDQPEVAPEPGTTLTDLAESQPYEVTAPEPEQPQPIAEPEPVDVPTPSVDESAPAPVEESQPQPEKP